jgi:hypothetical protein
VAITLWACASLAPHAVATTPLKQIAETKNFTATLRQSPQPQKSIFKFRKLGKLLATHKILNWYANAFRPVTFGVRFLRVCNSAKILCKLRVFISFRRASK